MQYVFGKTITTAKGTFAAGEALPEHWTGKETMRQLRETYGNDVLVESRGAAESFAAYGERLAAIEQALVEIKAALGVGTKPNGGEPAQAAKRPGRPRKQPVEASPSA